MSCSRTVLNFSLRLELCGKMKPTGMGAKLNLSVKSYRQPWLAGEVLYSVNIRLVAVQESVRK